MINVLIFVVLDYCSKNEKFYTGDEKKRKKSIWGIDQKKKVAMKFY